MTFKQKKSILMVFFSSAIFMLSACGKSFKSDALGSTGTVKVRILKNMINSTDQGSEQESFQFQVVELLNIYDLISLSGKFVRFYTQASNANGNLKGTQPLARFFKSKDGFFIPRDSFSMELAALYYNTQNLAQIDAKIGAENINTLPRKIIVGTAISNSSFQDNNAIYDGDMDAIIYLAYTEPNLPLELNGGIFAHEYFHSLFYKLIHKSLNQNSFFKEDLNPSTENQLTTKYSLSVPSNAKITYYSTEEIDRILAESKEAINPESNSGLTLTKQNIKDYYEFLLKGFNEGIADFWGWSYSQDINFINHSIPEVKAKRTLDLKTQNLTYPKLYTGYDLLALTLQKFENKQKMNSFVNNFSYKAGTRVAIFFKELTSTVANDRKISIDDAKIIVMSSIIKFLQNTGTKLSKLDFTTLNSSSLTTPQELILDFSKSMTLSNITECQLILKSYSNNSESLSNLSCQKIDDHYELIESSPEQSQSNSGNSNDEKTQ